MLEAIDYKRPVEIFVRHGKSEYTGKLPDLTPEGIAQVRAGAREVKPVTDCYQRLYAYSSPAQRAIGTAMEFLDEIGRPCVNIEKVDDIRPVDIYDFPRFIAAISDPNYHREYEAYMLKEEFDDPNPETRFCEPRSLIEQRVLRYLLRGVDEVAERFEDGEPLCSIHSAHFETLSRLIAPVCGRLDRFPVEKEDGPRNGEVVIIQAGKYNPRDLTILARSKMARVTLNPTTLSFDEISQG